MILPPRFGVEIETTGGSIAGRFYIIIHREFRGLAIFLEYNSITFYLDRMFFSRRLIFRALV